MVEPGPVAVTVVVTIHTTVLCQAVALLIQQVPTANGFDMLTRHDRAPGEGEDVPSLTCR